MTDTLFPTTVIGSLPRPVWVRELILARKNGQISEEETDRLLDPAIESVLRLQELAGLDELTDGEWRRESYVKVFADRVRGFKPDLNPSGGLPYPAVVEQIEYHRPLAADEIHYIRKRTQRRIKATLPAPYIIGRRMWHAEYSKAAYTVKEFLSFYALFRLKSNTIFRDHAILAGDLTSFRHLSGLATQNRSNNPAFTS